jgi:acetyl esterase/lipase
MGLRCGLLGGFCFAIASVLGGSCGAKAMDCESRDCAVTDAGDTASRSDGGTSSEARPDASSDAGARVPVDAGTEETPQSDAGGVRDAGRPMSGPPQTNGEFKVLDDVSYFDERRVLDLYLPVGAGPFPVIVYIHGGGWRQGDESEFAELWRAEAKRGYAVASVRYRLTPAGQWPNNIHDVKAAVRWLKANASKYQLDANRFAAWGASAGGHLAAVLATSHGVAALEGDLGNPSESSRVQALVDWYGPTDFLRMDEQAADIGCQGSNHGAGNSPESQLLGCRIGDCPQKVAEANPISYVDASDPPALLMHGSKDCVVPPGQSELLHRALTEKNVPSTYELLPGLAHNWGAGVTASGLQKIHAFLDSTLYSQR